MEYGKLIREAWTITWRYRFLWVLGLLAGGSSAIPSAGGGGGGPRPSPQPSGGAPGDLSQVSPALTAAGQGLSAWAAANVGLLVVLGVVVAAVLLTLIVMSFIARGGMAQATTDLATGHASSFASAWRAGRHLFWRYVGLWLLLALAAVLVVAALGVVVAVAVLVGTLSQSPLAGVAIAAMVAAAVVVSFVWFVLRMTRASGAPRWLVAVVATLFGLPVFTVVLVIALTLSIVVSFAQRAIAVEDVGPVAALRSGWRLMRTHIGESLVTWLINVGLALATGVAVVGGALGAVVLLAAVGALVFAVAGISTPLFAYAGLAGLLLLVGVLTLVGITNTFFWSYWTLVYLRLSGRAAPATT